MPDKTLSEEEREDLPKTEPPPTCVEPVTKDVSNLSDLRSVCSIDLGLLPGWVPLQKTFAAGDNTQSGCEETLLDFLPEWVGALTLDFGDAEACLKYQSAFDPGCFWSSERGYGSGFYKTALLYAIATVHAFSDAADDVPTVAYAKCDLTGSKLRTYIENASPFIYTNPTFGSIFGGCDTSAQPNLFVGSTGFVTAGFTVPLTSGVAAWTWCGVHICERIKIYAALADYYFHWAARFHHRCFYSGVGDFTDLMMGTVCARAGLAELMEIAALLVHEYGHVSGSLYDCKNGSNLFNCCQYLYQFAFLQRMTAKFGLPSSHLPACSVNDRVLNRFNFPLLSDGTRPWSYALQTSSTSGCGTGTLVVGQHCDLLDEEHRLDSTWTSTSTCSDPVYSNTGSNSYFTDYEHCQTLSGGRKTTDVPDDVERRDRLE